MAGFHANTSIGGGTPDVSFGGGAVNVDASTISISVVAFPTAEPKDSTYYRVASRGVWTNDVASGTAAPEYGSRAGATTNFFSNNVTTQRCSVSSTATSQAEFGGRYRVGFDRFSIVNQKHFLVTHAYDHLVPFIKGWPTAGSEKGEKGEGRERDEAKVTHG